MNKKTTRQLLMIAKDLTSFEEKDFFKEIEAIKKTSKIMDFFDEFIRFKGSLNNFMDTIANLTDDKHKLHNVPVLIDFIKLNKYIKDEGLVRKSRINKETLTNQLFDL